MATNWDHFEDTASRMIERYGMMAVLRRHGAPDRWCKVCMVAWTPFEKMALVNQVDRKMLIAVDGVDIPPDRERDIVVTYKQPLADPPVEDEQLTIAAPVGKVEMGGETVLWRLTVRR